MRYDVVIEVKNIEARDKEEAIEQALDLIVSPFPVNVRIEAFEKKPLTEFLGVRA